MKGFFIFVFGFISVISGFVAKLATPVFIVKFIYDVFVANVPFWTAAVSNGGWFIVTMLASILCFIVSATIAAALVES